jgi:hypothetical protein
MAALLRALVWGDTVKDSTHTNSERHVYDLVVIFWLSLFTLRLGSNREITSSSNAPLVSSLEYMARAVVFAHCLAYQA